MLNRVHLIGNVGNIPELKTAGSSKVVNLSLATSETYTDAQGQKQTQTEWHSVNLWGALAETVAKYVKKGDRLYIGGSIKYRQWEKDGVKHYATDIKADIMKMLSTSKKEESAQQVEPHHEWLPEPDVDSDLPF